MESPGKICDVVGAIEIADRLDVKLRTIHTWRTARKIMPPADLIVNGSAAYIWETIVEWCLTPNGQGQTREELLARYHTADELDQWRAYLNLEPVAA